MQNSDSDMALLFENDFESLLASNTIFEATDKQNYDDVVVDDIPFCNSLLEPDNFLFSDLTQGKREKKSPFHKTDIKMSDNSRSSQNSDGTMENQESFNEGTILLGADQDLLDYFGGTSSDEDITTKTNMRSRNKENINNKKNVLNTKVADKAKIIPVRNVAPISRARDQQPVANNLISNTNSPHLKPFQSVKVVKVIHTSTVASDGTNDEEEIVKVLEEKSRKNAQQAKLNRERKKAYMQQLEKDVENLQKENGELKTENKMLTCRTTALEEEVHYLKSVLANESSLSKLLNNIENIKDVRLSSSFQSRKRSAALDHCYESPSKWSKPSTAGICLHVDKDDVSLEFCSYCSKMSKSKDND